MSLTLEELKAHANPSNWEIHSRYTATETVEVGGIPTVIETPMIRAENRVLRKVVDVPATTFNNYLTVNLSALTENVEVLFDEAGTLVSVSIGGAAVTVS